MITLDEIENVSLKKSGFGGYKIEDVDNFIDKVIAKVRSLERANKELESRIEEQDKEVQKYKENADSVQSALISAQKTAKQIVMEATQKSAEQIADANEKAEKMLLEAKQKAESLVQEAQERADKMNAETDTRIEETINRALRESSGKIEENNRILETQKSNILRLMEESNKFKNSLFAIYKEHLNLINSISNEANIKEQKQRLDDEYPAMEENHPVKSTLKKNELTPSAEKAEENIQMSEESAVTETVVEDSAEKEAETSAEVSAVESISESEVSESVSNNDTVANDEVSFGNQKNVTDNRRESVSPEKLPDNSFKMTNGVLKIDDGAEKSTLNYQNSGKKKKKRR